MHQTIGPVSRDELNGVCNLDDNKGVVGRLLLIRKRMRMMINQPVALGKHGAGLMEWRFQVAISAPPSTLATSMHLITSTSKHLGVP